MIDTKPMHRRRFLQWAGAAGMTALVAACDTGQPPTGDPATSLPERPAHTPTATASATPTGTPSPTTHGGTFYSPLHSPLQPTPTPTPTVGSAPTDTVPAATPTDTPTPTPPPTPFPPGAPTRLGLFVAWYHPQVMELIDTGNVAVLKTLEFDPNFLSEVRSRSPQTLIVGRMTLGQINLATADPLAEARRAVDAVRPLALDDARRGLVDGWEGFNEPVPGDAEQMRRLAEVEAERVRLLAAEGQRAVVGNFGTGQPPIEWWPAFRPALEAAAAHDGYLGLHEYSAPTMWYHTNVPPLTFEARAGDEGWLTLRYRKVYRQFVQPWGLDLPLILGECGIDGLVQNRPGPPGKGWKHFGPYWAELGMGPDSAGNYIEQLAWYDHELQLDSYVAGAAIFAMTAFEEWDSYQIQGEAAQILHQYLSVHPAR
ncbi:MAG: twin-arginine translocation signal domain-containing protein [Anaerolineae bacterium]|nr:twin-arginine translocation signal domain-containing protein [Anaerolineae bacterium]